MADPFAALAVNASFATFGKFATYTPPGGGAAVDCIVIRDRRDRMLELERGRSMHQGDTVEARASEIASPAHNGVFRIYPTEADRASLTNGDEVTIVNDPRTEDPERMVWACTVA